MKILIHVEYEDGSIDGKILEKVEKIRYFFPGVFVDFILKNGATYTYDLRTLKRFSIKEEK